MHVATMILIGEAMAVYVLVLLTHALLIACGISGARQFTIGMENSELVVAVNEDATAGIFEFANLRIKGDLLEVIPAVIRRLRG